MTLKLLLDEDINPAVAEGLRRRAIDAVSVYDIGRANWGISDEAQLSYAVTEGRVLVTNNRRDYQALDATWRLQGRSHAGMLWCLEKSLPRRDVGGLIRALEQATQRYTALADLCLPLARQDLGGHVDP